MTAVAPTYDLVLLLDPQAEDAARAKIVADARSAIEAQGELLRHDEWGTRTLAYPINRKTVAEYHMMQFHAPSADLLRQLDRSLRLADDAIRHRIIKLKPGVPDPPDMRSSADPLRASATASPSAPAAPTGADQPVPAPEPPPAEAPVEAPSAEAPVEPPPAEAPVEAPSAEAPVEPPPAEADTPSAPAEGGHSSAE
jgi:small subunit ribosomal protein S6